MRTDNAHRYRVLLADDQADIRDALRLLLKNEGYETHAAASPAEALSAIEGREFDKIDKHANRIADAIQNAIGAN